MIYSTCDYAIAYLDKIEWNEIEPNEKYYDIACGVVMGIASAKETADFKDWWESL